MWQLIKHVSVTIVLPIAIMVSLISCSENEPKRESGRNYEGKELRIVVHTFDSKRQLIKATKDYGTTHQSGFARWSPDDNRCDIYVLRSKRTDSNRYDAWGHEIGHCVYGSFHQ